jgi:hypothetical protein
VRPGERKTRNWEKEEGEREIVRAGLSCPYQTERERREKEKKREKKGRRRWAASLPNQKLRKSEEWKKKRGKLRETCKKEEKGKRGKREVAFPTPKPARE